MRQPSEEAMVSVLFYSVCIKDFRLKFNGNISKVVQFIFVNKLFFLV